MPEWHCQRATRAPPRARLDVGSCSSDPTRYPRNASPSVRSLSAPTHHVPASTQDQQHSRFLLEPAAENWISERRTPTHSNRCCGARPIAAPSSLELTPSTIPVPYSTPPCCETPQSVRIAHDDRPEHQREPPTIPRADSSRGPRDVGPGRWHHPAAGDSIGMMPENQTWTGCRHPPGHSGSRPGMPSHLERPNPQPSTAGFVALCVQLASPGAHSSPTELDLHRPNPVSSGPAHAPVAPCECRSGGRRLLGATAYPDAPTGQTSIPIQ